VSSANGRPLPLPAKAQLAARIWWAFFGVRVRLYREPLPLLVARLGTVKRPSTDPHTPARLSSAVDKSLRLGSRRPTCLVNALVLFRLLREQGEAAELVIGLSPNATSEAAHAWIEINGDDVGPPPGKGNHSELARFG
jgi:hypothetical protein